MPFPYYHQPDQMDCGPTCLRMVAKHYGRNFKVQTLRKLCEINREGVSLLGISDASEKIDQIYHLPQSILLNKIHNCRNQLSF